MHLPGLSGEEINYPFSLITTIIMKALASAVVWESRLLEFKSPHCQPPELNKIIYLQTEKRVKKNTATN